MVALRKESVDRNSSGAKADSVTKVALRKESVDRNLWCRFCRRLARWSLSARRAWIEIVEFHLFASSGVVALRKESVDRNLVASVLAVGRAGSLSARRAWIEMPKL